MPFLNLFKLKPDIYNTSRSTWLEIKPFSPSGVADAGQAVFKYAPMMVYGVYPEAGWTPSDHQAILADGTPMVFFNAGGIVFYSDRKDLAEDLLAITSLAMARNMLPYLMTGVRQAVIAMASARLQIDSSRLEQQLSIAGILASFGVV